VDYTADPSAAPVPDGGRVEREDSDETPGPDHGERRQGDEAQGLRPLHRDAHQDGDRRQDQALAEQIRTDASEIRQIHQAVLGVRGETEELRGLVADQKKELDGQLTELKAAQAKLRNLQKQAADAVAAERGEYQRLAANKTRLAAAIRTATAARAALAKRIDKLREEQRNQGRIPSVYNGTLSWPMAGNVTQEFGCTGVV